MEHFALYRKWRPQNFNSVVGQEDVIRVLKNAVRSDCVSHAYLFCGSRGTGKTSTARILAKALNCLNLQDGEPCNECEACRSINDGSYMDVFEIDAASNRGISEAKALIENVPFVPTQGKYKVYIIDEVHMLTNEAFNTMLKTLEEPPSHAVFILATTEARKIPLTISSRCQRFDFRAIDEDTLFGALKKIAEAENFIADDDALDVLAEKAKGSMRDALSLMDQAAGGDCLITAEELSRLTGSVPYSFWPGFFRSIAQNDLPGVFTAIDGVEREGKDLRQFFRDFRGCAGDLISGGAKEGKSHYHQMIRDCAQCFTPAQILEIITICGESEIVFRYNRDGKAVCRFLTAKIMKALFPTAPAAPVAVVAPMATEKNDAVTPWQNGVKAENAAACDNDIPLPEEPPAEDENNIPPWETASSLRQMPKFPRQKPIPKKLPEREKAPSPKPAETKKTPSAKAEPKPAEKKKTPSAKAEPKQEDAKKDHIDMEALWSKLLSAVRQKNKSTYTWLSHGEASALSATKFVVRYTETNRIFYEKVIQQEHTAIVNEVAEDLFGHGCRFQAEMGSAESKIEEMSLFD